MQYEVVELKEKVVVGVSSKTSNADPEMGTVIGGLWEKLYQDGVGENIKNRANEYAIGLYSEYDGDTYCATAGFEVSKADDKNLSVKIIPAGRYAKFNVQGDMHKAVAEAWSSIWATDLDRSYTGDFEEYLNEDMENAKLNIYVALK